LLRRAGADLRLVLIEIRWERGRIGAFRVGLPEAGVTRAAPAITLAGLIRGAFAIRDWARVR